MRSNFGSFDGGVEQLDAILPPVVLKVLRESRRVATGHKKGGWR